jgi:hypothetical protein
MRHKFICATGPERFELRTSGLGCQVSTITFLTSLVTIFCTLFGVVILYALIKLIEGIAFTGSASKGGWAIDGDGREGVWVRSAEPWGRWWRKVTGRLGDDEVREVDGGTGERSWWMWRGLRKSGNVRLGAGESRPLLA